MSASLPRVRLRASQDSSVPSAVTFWVPFCVVDKKERCPGEGTPRYVSLKASTPMNLVVKARLAAYSHVVKYSLYIIMIF
jgi:hypothetical protein